MAIDGMINAEYRQWIGNRLMAFRGCNREEADRTIDEALAQGIIKDLIDLVARLSQ